MRASRRCFLLRGTYSRSSAARSGKPRAPTGASAACYSRLAVASGGRMPALNAGRRSGSQGKPRRSQMRCMSAARISWRMTSSSANWPLMQKMLRSIGARKRRSSQFSNSCGSWSVHCPCCDLRRRLFQSRSPRSPSRKGCGSRKI